MEEVAVYVPAESPGRPALVAGDLLGIVPGSGIVGTAQLANGELMVTIDYEGAIYDQANMVTFADRVLQAAGRHVARYPTRARMTVPASRLKLVGVFLPQTGEVLVKEEAREFVARWLDVEELDDAELECSGVWSR